ncbi:MAG: hypothetical protein KF809_17695 [Chloroflexi bacterium]|nr:hypothetical protein [Chloroflexota bacterium]
MDQDRATTNDQHARTDDDRLLAGVGRRDISPPDGIRTAGFSSRETVVEGVDEPLTVTALVLEGCGARVCIMAIDLCMAPQDIALDWRAAVGAAIGTPSSHVLLNLSHTHSGAALLRTQPEFSDQAELLLAYEATLRDQLVGAASDAASDLRPARVGAGAGTSTIGVQRREPGPDGYTFLGEVPDGPIDPVVSVVRVDDLDGQAIAILTTYGCHTVSVGPRATVASPDFPGPMRRLVEATFGGHCLFLQGGGGDIMPCWGMSHEVDASDSKERIGQMLGGEVVRVAASIRTHVERGERTSLPSLLGPGMTMRPLVPVTGPACTALAARSEAVTLDLVPLPSAEDAARLREERVADLERALAGDSDRALTVARRQVAWADELVAAVARGDRTRPMEVQAIRVNDIVFTAIAAEVFSATTRAIRAASTFAHTVALGYSNGVLCYLPTAADFPAGGWDVHDRYRIPDLVFQAYLLPVAIAPDSEARVREGIERLLTGLADGPG